jgi:predicted Rossmann fold nucleotide-binding protein DprA/Smf involved in DNA uptake
MSQSAQQEDEMVIAVVGSRNFKNLELVINYVKSFDPGTKVISGGARGVDSIAIEAAKSAGFDWEEFKAAWEDLTQPDAVIKERDDGTKYDAKAGYRRNTILVEKADKVIAFWDGTSKGTMDSVNKAKRLGKEVVIIKDGQ